MARNFRPFIFAVFTLCLNLVPGILEASGVSFGPGITELLLRPGEKGATVFHVLNETDQDMRINVEAVNWLVRHLQREGRIDDVYEWMDLGNYREFTVPKHSRGKLSVDVKAPDSFEGERIAQVFFQYSPVEATTEQAAAEKQVSSRIGLLVCLGAKGKEKLYADLALDAVKAAALEDGKADVSFSYTIKNLGNIHISPRGFVRIKKGKDTLSEMEIGVVQGLYTNEKRAYRTVLKAVSLPSGEYDAEVDIKMISYGMEKRMQKTQKIPISEVAE
ncbi:MAG: hypothetical protein HY587_05910 [Candidatus Omnitrophica bacterium]|nr:hypothetical protein [Candidatus Omnitrophota bacterium]